MRPADIVGWTYALALFGLGLALTVLMLVLSRMPPPLDRYDPERDPSIVRERRALDTDARAGRIRGRAPVLAP